MLGSLIHSTFRLFSSVLTPSVTTISLRDAIQSVLYKIRPNSVRFYSIYFEYKVTHQHTSIYPANTNKCNIIKFYILCIFYYLAPACFDVIAIFRGLTKISLKSTAINNFTIILRVSSAGFGQNI